MNTPAALFPTPDSRRALLRATAGLLVVLAVGALFFHLARIGRIGVDWHVSFYPALRAVAAGGSPYATGPVFNPPWAYWLLLPLAYLPVHYGAALMATLFLLATALAAYRLKLKPLGAAALACSFPAAVGIWTGNLEWMILLGALLPARLGLFLVLVKPQIGAGIALYWLAEAYRAGGWKRVALDFAPVSAAFGLSFLIYGNYLFPSGQLVSVPWNWSLFPYTLPVGIALLALAVYRRSLPAAMSGSVLLPPYIGPHSYIFLMLGLGRYPLAAAAAAVLSWLVGMGVLAG